MERVSPKGGWKTSEFWVAAVVCAAGGTVALHGERLLGLGAMALVSVGYGLARALEKGRAHDANGQIASATAATRQKVC